MNFYHVLTLSVFNTGLPVDHIESMKDSCRVMRKQLCETRALTLFDLSAQQGNAEAYVQIGDMYYYQRAGLTYPGRKKEAAEFYQRAADLHHTQAIFNLGIMHEVCFAMKSPLVFA